MTCAICNDTKRVARPTGHVGDWEWEPCEACSPEDHTAANIGNIARANTAIGIALMDAYEARDELLGRIEHLDAERDRLADDRDKARATAGKLRRAARESIDDYHESEALARLDALQEAIGETPKDWEP